MYKKNSVANQEPHHFTRAPKQLWSTILHLAYKPMIENRDGNPKSLFKSFAMVGTVNQCCLKEKSRVEKSCVTSPLTMFFLFIGQAATETGPGHEA
jgi:hypothetical protein